MPLALIAKEPDLGTAVTLVPVLLAVAYLAGMRMRILGYLFIGLLVIGLSACAAVLVLEHLRLALQARGRNAARTAVAFLVPGAPLVYAWGRGSRVAPAVYAIFVITYLILLLRP